MDRRTWLETIVAFLEMTTSPHLLTRAQRCQSDRSWLVFAP